MSPLVRLRDLPSIAALFEIAADRPCPRWDELPADAWTALAAALQADRRRSLARAARVADALAHLPAGARFPWLARVYAVETLVLSAAARHDWAAAARYARLGRGRLNRLLALLAQGGRGQPVRRRHIRQHLALWLLAPLRRATWPLVRAPGRLWPGVAEARATETPRPGVHARHVELLGAAAHHDEVATDDVLALAAAWRAEVDDAALARGQARALELGLRDGAARARALRDRFSSTSWRCFSRRQTARCRRSPGAHGSRTICNPGPRSAARADPGGVARARRGRRRTVPASARGVGTLARAAGGVGARRADRSAARRWRRCGATSVRDRLWGYCCALSHQHGARAAWAAWSMFDWLADRAEYVGDLVAVLANRENARIALASAR